MTTAHLEILNGEQAGQLLLLHEQACTVGRTRDNTLVLADATVSRQHAKIYFQSGRHHVLDLHSTHGTWVNGGRVTRAPLADQDTLRFGNVELRYTTAGASREAGAAAAELALEMPADLLPAPAATAPPIERPALTAAGEDPFAGDEEGPGPMARTPPGPRGAPRTGGAGLLHQDLAQRGPWVRAAAILLALAVALVLGYGALRGMGFLTRESSPADEGPGDPGSSRPSSPQRPP